uniref:Dol-P-Glc:Glc(2)Man(9)GlcNAc(2)-PP-Dol alpha-1,2-glucosyltransferase n=1 Tax=Rhodnius prolixus TaxID=13249 RepID=T1I1M3_RHOPR
MMVGLNFLQNEAIQFRIWLLLYCFISCHVFMTVYRTQPIPFIDEIFHIRQAKLYCATQFNQWDDKITTLPGLYLFTVGIYGPLSVFGAATECSVFLLRGMNLIISVANFYIIYSILQSLDTLKQIKRNYKVWEAFNISVFPVMYFFNFLYYTDTLSTFSVLLMFRLHLAGNLIIAPFIGLLSVLIRQTNIVWVGFFLLDALHQCYLKLLPKTHNHKRKKSSILD